MDFKETNISQNKALEENNSQRRHSSKSTIYLAFAVVLFLMSSTILAATILYYDSMKTKPVEEPPAEVEIVEVTYTQSEVDKMVSDAVSEAKETTKEATVGEMKDVLRNASEENSGVLFLLREYFPDYVIFSESAGKFGYYPIDKSLKPLNVNLDNLLYDEENDRMVYMEDGTNVSSHVCIDVSSHQKNINWGKVKASGVDQAIVRCAFRGYGSGKLVEDDYFKANIEGAIENGVKVGVYVYSQAINETEAIEEAKFALDLVAPYDIKLPITIDIEEVNDTARTDNLTVEERTANVIAFCKTVEEAGYKPMIYSNNRYFIKNLNMSLLDDYEKWYAMYNTTIYFPYDISIWQYSANGRVDGISGVVDLNISFKDWGD